MYCHCGSKFEWGEIGLVQLSLSDKHLTHAYICGRCGKISHAVPKGESMYGPANARAPLGWHGKSDGTYIQTWATNTSGERIQTMGYIPYPTIKVNGMDQGRDHLLRIWQKLDYELDQIKSTSNADLQQWSKYRARAFAEVIAQLMSPFYVDSDAVALEALERWKARQSGTEHHTPGLGEVLWNPTELARIEKASRVAASPAPARKAVAAPRPTGNRVPDSAVNTAKQGIEMGMFTVKQMADTYKMTEAELKEQLGLA